MAAHAGQQGHHPDIHAQREERGRDTRRVTVVSAVVNLFLCFAQIVIGLLAN